MKHTILCIDDEIDNVEALERLFRRKYTVLKAVSGKQALEILDQHPELSLIISDQRMPEMTGVEFLQKSMQTHPDTIRILLTGYTDIESVIAAINQGHIYRYVTKPWDPNDLMIAVDRAIERWELGHQIKQQKEQIEKAYAELKTLDQAKSNFMILINHELKTPLTSILNFLDILCETKLDSEQKTYTDRIRKSANRLHSMIQDALVISSAETGQLKVHPQDFPVQDLEKALPNELIQMSQSKGQKIKFDFIEGSLYSDKRILNDVLHRLIHNAVKFGSEHSQISVKCQKESSHTQFSIKNIGSHIPHALIEKILQPFSLNEDVMKHSKGSGLGLTVCQAYLKTLGSQLRIESGDNEVTVSFSL